MLKDFWKKKKPEEKSLLTFPLGTDEKGDEIFCDLARMPHLLLAARSEADKTKFLLSLLERFSENEPKEVQFFLADSMKEDFSSYANSPHLLAPVVSLDADKAISSLNWIVIEMERRFQLFQEASVRDIRGYNEAVKEILPRIVVVVSELAELIIPRREETEMVLCRLCQMGRAAGIHLIIATSHPEEKVLSGLIRANVPSRISFALFTADESRNILDQMGAEDLEKGELLYLPLAAPKPMKIKILI